MRFDQKRAELAFAAWVGLLVLLCMGSRYVWPNFPHSISATELKIDIQKSSSTAAQLAMLLDLTRHDATTETYLQAFADNVDEDVKREISQGQKLRPDPDIAGTFT